MSFFASLLLFLNGVSIWEGGARCVQNASLLGEYVPHSKVIITCPSNHSKLGVSLSETVKHEFFHFLYEKHKREQPFIPEPLFTWIVREFLPSGEVMFVILHTRDYSSDEELEARIFSRLPDFFLVFARALG